MSIEKYSNFSVSGRGIVSVCLLWAFVSGCSEEQAPTEAPAVRPVKTVILAGESGAPKFQYPGRVRAAQRADLSFEVAGKLIELPVKEGEEIERGTLIAALDSRDLSSNLKSAQAESDKSAANFERASTLIKDGYISKTDYDRLSAAKDVAAANLTKARKAVDDTKLYAPFSGHVATRFVENFQDIQAKEPIVSLQDMDQIEILINVPESRAIKVGQPGATPPKLHAVFDAAPEREFALEVKEFSTEADPTTQTFQAVLSMPQPEGLSILPGMTGMVWIEPSASTEASGGGGFTIPAAALFADESGMPHVWIVDPKDNTVHRRAVETADLTGGDQIRVVAGLKAGEMVAVSAVSRLREGFEIRPVDKVEF